MSDFYLTLPSDSSMDLYPDNTLSTFRTHLNPAVSLKHDEWEVGVASLSFPKEWYNLLNTKNVIRLKFQGWTANSMQTSDSCVVETHLPTDNYISVAHLLNVLNASLHELWNSKKVRDFIYSPPQAVDDSYNTRVKLAKAAESKGPYTSFKQDPQSKKVSLVIEHLAAYSLMRMLPRITLEIEGVLVTVLGWDGEIQEFYLDQLARKKMNTTIDAPNQAQLQMAMDVFYLYSDIVEPQRVGNIVAPLLDVFPSRKGYHRPSRIHYVPLKYARMTTVDMYIRTGMGNPVPFVHGKVVVKLHFRKKP